MIEGEKGGMSLKGYGFLVIMILGTSWVLSTILSLAVSKIGKLLKNWPWRIYDYIFGVDLDKGSMYQLFMIFFISYFTWRAIKDEGLRIALIEGSWDKIINELKSIFDWMKGMFTLKNLILILFILAAIELHYLYLEEIFPINPVLILKLYLTGILIVTMVGAGLLIGGKHVASIMWSNLKWVLGIIALSYVPFVRDAITKLVGSGITYIINAIKIFINSTLERIFSISSTNPSIITFDRGEEAYIKLLFGIEDWQIFSVISKIIIAIIILIFDWKYGGRIKKFFKKIIWKTGRKYEENLVPVLARFTTIKEKRTVQNIWEKYDKLANYRGNLISLIRQLKSGGDVHYISEKIIETLDAHKDDKRVLIEELEEEFGERLDVEKAIKKSIAELSKKWKEEKEFGQ